MGWVEDQIRQRVQHDDAVFHQAMAGMADVVMGRQVARAMQDDRVQTKSAMDEILRYYRVKPQELPDTAGSLEDQLDEMLRPCGMMHRPVVLEGAWYKDAANAMLGIRRDDGTAVALLPRGAGGYTFYDGKAGKRVRIDQHTADLLEREAVCFYKPLPLTTLTIRDLLRYMVQALSVSDVVLLGLAALAVSLVGLLTPRINYALYSDVIASGSMRLLVAVAVLLTCVTLSQLLLQTIRSLLLGRMSAKITVQVQSASMMRLLALPAGFFRRYTSGELASRLSYIGAICATMMDVALTTALTSVFSLVYVAQMLQYGPELVVPGLCVILFTVLFSVAVTLKQIRVSRKAMALSAKEAGIDYMLLAGIQKIKLVGAEKRAFAKWADQYTKAARLSYDPPAFLKLSPVLSACISLVGTIVIYYFTIASRVSLADYYAFNTAYGMVMGAFSALAGVAVSLAGIRPMLEMVAPILQTAPEAAEKKQSVTHLSGAVEMNNVSFRYREGAPLILDDLSLKIPAGQYVAIVGRTGCGKSTLMRLLLGFETPQKGAVFYDGKDLTSLDLRSLRRHIGSVTQGGKLFPGDIFSNITLSAPWLSLTDAWRAADTAGIAQDIRAMPMGMQTMISERSGGISGGQKQRLMIARAIAPNPTLLLFDEATSALDNVTQRKVACALDSLKCTRIVIAHRLSTIRECDRILVMAHGRIVEDGDYDALMAQNGVFAALVKRQQLEDALSPD